MRTREDILQDLLAEVLDDPGALDPSTRKAAATNGAQVDGEKGKVIQALAAKIHGGAYRVTEEDIAAARKAGLSEDEVFELVVSSAVGAAKTRFDAAMSALAAASAPVKIATGGSR